MRTRRTQTNEAARCAVLMPALAELPQPLALLEVGASAGLTLLPDIYSYDYEGYLVAGTDPSAPTLKCRPSGPVPLPAQVPEIAWRAGIDINPLDVNNAEDVEWLSCLVWPGEADRAERLQAAVAVARTHPPTLYQGDLVEDLAGRPASARRHDSRRVPLRRPCVCRGKPPGEFARAVGELGAVWLSNEGPDVLPGLAGGDVDPHGFLLVEGGASILARTDPHGTWLEWVRPSSGSSRAQRAATLVVLDS